MDPFAKKMIQGSLAFAAVMLLMFAVLTTIYVHMRPPCSEKVVAEQISPGGRWNAAVMERRCGENSPFQTHVNLHKADEPIQPGYFSGRSKEGEIFLVDLDAQSAPVTLQWISEQQLVVRCEACASEARREAKPRWHDVEIRYELR